MRTIIPSNKYGILIKSLDPEIRSIIIYTLIGPFQNFSFYPEKIV